jgi:hypothetical protein
MKNTRQYSIIYKTILKSFLMIYTLLLTDDDDDGGRRRLEDDDTILLYNLSRSLVVINNTA